MRETATMDLADAFQIVLDLAKQNLLDSDDPELSDEAMRQREAIALVEDFAVNQLGDE